MKAELTTGEIVPLEKDCECITHNGPHWVHMADFWRQKNRDMPVGNALCLGAKAQEELMRLDALRREFEQHGIVRLIREPSDELSELQRQRLERHHEDIRRRAEAIHPTPKNDREKRYDEWKERNDTQVAARHSL